MIMWRVTTVYSHHVKYPTDTWRLKQKIKDNKIQRPWHYLVPGPTPCPEVVTVSYIRPAEVPTLFSVEGDTQVEQKNHAVRFLTGGHMKILWEELQKLQTIWECWMYPLVCILHHAVNLCMLSHGCLHTVNDTPSTGLLLLRLGQSDLSAVVGRFESKRKENLVDWFIGLSKP